MEQFMFLLRSLFLFICESSLFELMTHISFLNFFLFSSFFFFYFWFGSFWCAPSPFFFLILIDLLSWTEFQHVEDPCLGYFWRKFLFFRLKEGAMEFYWCFRINKHGHISFWIMIAWFLERLTPATDFSDSKYLTFFFFFSFYRPIFCLDCPLRVFNLTDFYFFFFWSFFFNAFSEKNLKFIAAWKIWLIDPIWCLPLVLVGNKHVTKANRFLFCDGKLKGVSNTCMPICYYERNQFFMPSFKIASNLFIIFINKFNDSINMIYCAILLFSSLDILQTSRKSCRQLMPTSSSGRQGCTWSKLWPPCLCSITATWSTLALIEAFAWAVEGFFSTLAFCFWKVRHPESSKDCTLYLSAWQFSVEWSTSPPWYSHFALTS